MAGDRRKHQLIPRGGINRWYHEAWRFKPRLNDSTGFALLNLEHYLNGLIVEWNRLMESEESTARWGHEELDNDNIEPPTAYWETGMSVYLDVHFYLICWDNIKKNFETLVHEEKTRDIGLAWRGVKVLLRDASRARDFYEHSNDWGNQNHAIGLGAFGDHLSVIYPPKGAKEKFNAQLVILGRTEVLKVAKAYEMVLKVFKEA